MVLSRVVSEKFNVEKCRDIGIRVRGHSRSLKVVPFDRLGMVTFLIVFYSNFVPVLDIRLVTIHWPWNPHYGALNVIGTNTYRSATYDFLLTFYSNRGHISYRFRDKLQFQSKITKFSHPRVFCAPIQWLN